MGVIVRWVIGVALFTGLLVGGTAYLQDTLLLLEEAGPTFHWGVILLALPLAAGTLLRAMVVPFRLFALLGGTLLATGALFHLYRTQFWAEPPGYLEVSLYFVAVAGLSHVTAYPVSDTFRVFWRFLLFLLPGNYRMSTSGKGAPAGGERGGQSVPNVPVSDFSLNLINGLVGLASLLISVFSIFFMGQNN